MKAFKLTMCAILAALIITIPQSSTGYALASQYAMATSRDVYLYSQKSTEYALFTIPYTYCVEIIASDEEWYYVKYAEDVGVYQAVYGYCLKNMLTVVDTPPENTYLYMPLIVTYKSQTNAPSLPTLGDISVTAAYYGTYYSGGAAYSYVLYNGSFGYISGANDNYALNELPKAKEEEESKNTSSSITSDNKTIIAIVLTILASAALLILFFTTRKKT
jgi:hypothetical protein